jgi:hypothetical protein
MLELSSTEPSEGGVISELSKTKRIEVLSGSGSTSDVVEGSTSNGAYLKLWMVQRVKKLKIKVSSCITNGRI